MGTVKLAGYLAIASAHPVNINLSFICHLVNSFKTSLPIYVTYVIILIDYILLYQYEDTMECKYLSSLLLIRDGGSSSLLS